MNAKLKKYYKRANWLIKHPDFLFERKELGKFPEKPSSYWKIKLQLYSLVNTLKELRLENKLGSLHCQPHTMSTMAWKKLLLYNPNNLGNWSLANEKEILSGPPEAERGLIKAMVDLYGGSLNDWEGYITSGATEANIFSAWMGRKMFEKKYARKQICLLTTNLAHNSVSKAADVVGVEPFNVGLDRKSWSMDLSSLEKTIKKLYKKHYRAFLIPLTLGYTQTGTNDDYQEIIKRLKQLERKSGIDVFIWLDAALNGLVLPFTSRGFFPLKNTKMNIICVDFHKAGMAPIPSGIVLYRKFLRKNIERSIPYINFRDSTLLGSRSGIPAVAIFSLINLLGKRGFKRIILQCQQNKEAFIKEVSQLFPRVEIVDDPRGISLGLVSKKKLTNKFMKKYGLYAKKHRYKFTDKSEALYIYKVAFLYRRQRKFI